MSYKYETFLSYRRVNEWPAFVQGTFLPMFKHWLQEELDDSPKIFYDADRIETGEAWPYELAEALATSKLMVCLWSKQYFTSPWCKAELGHMLARRKSLTSSAGSPRLILPVTIHDGESIPPELSEFHRLDIRDYSSPWLGDGSLKKEELSDRIKTLAGHVGNALRRVPDYDPDWMGLAVDEFSALFTARNVQSSVPSLGINKS